MLRVGSIMPRPGRPPRRLLVAAVPVAAMALWIGLTLPPRARDLRDPAGAEPVDDSLVVRGVFHVHTTQSDGGGSLDDVAAAAAATGLDFVVVTDHGDGTDGSKAAYRRGVLVLEGVEISTTGGHYVAVGMSPTPYPLGGDARGVVDDVRRFGGFGVVAHPTSPRGALRWTDWSLPVDAVEWINGDSQWRQHGPTSLVGAAIHYLWRPAESLASLLRRPVDALARWDAVAAQRSVVGVGGTDAHARLATGGGDDGYAGGLVFRFPGYEALFRTYGLRVELDRPFRGVAGRDAGNLVSQLRAGRVYTAMGAMARPATFSFSGTRADGRAVPMGASTPAGQSLTLTAHVTAAEGSTIRLMRNGDTIRETVGANLRHDLFTTSRAAAYRVEVLLPPAVGARPVPWIVSNPVYVTAADRPVAPRPSTRGAGAPLTRGGWRAERSTDGEATIREDETGIELGYRLGNDEETYAAAVYDLEPGMLNADTVITFAASATSPMRGSLQLRHGGDIDMRWRHSFYVAPVARPIHLSVGDFEAVSRRLPASPDPAFVDGLLLVVDTVNLRPGTTGAIRIENLQIHD